MDEIGSSAVLVGAPGAGKSTVGAIIARQLGLDFTDVDPMIELIAGKSITDIFLEDGEPAFRALERSATLEALARPGIVSLGGGAVTSAEIRDALRGRTVVWLDVSAQQASRRVGLTGTRPLLTGNIHSTMVRLMNERAALYEQVATVRLDTNGMAPDEVAACVIAELGRGGA